MNSRNFSALLLSLLLGLISCHPSPVEDSSLQLVQFRTTEESYALLKDHQPALFQLQVANPTKKAIASVTFHAAEETAFRIRSAEEWVSADASGRLTVPWPDEHSDTTEFSIEFLGKEPALCLEPVSLQLKNGNYVSLSSANPLLFLSVPNMIQRGQYYPCAKRTEGFVPGQWTEPDCVLSRYYLRQPYDYTENWSGSGWTEMSKGREGGIGHLMVEQEIPYRDETTKEVHSYSPYMDVSFTVKAGGTKKKETIQLLGDEKLPEYALSFVPGDKSSLSVQFSAAENFALWFKKEEKTAWASIYEFHRVSEHLYTCDNFDSSLVSDADYIILDQDPDPDWGETGVHIQKKGVRMSDGASGERRFLFFKED